MKPAVCYTLFFLAGLVLGMILAPVLSPHKQQRTATITKTDTLTIRDTVVERQPVFVTLTKTDTLLIAVRDTVRVRDTSYVIVSREQKHYRSDNYEAWISGYRPALDSIRVFPETKYITTETISVAPRKRWGIGIQVGYGISLPDGRPQLAPYIGVGISYDLIRF